MCVCTRCFGLYWLIKLRHWGEPSACYLVLCLVVYLLCVLSYQCCPAWQLVVGSSDMSTFSCSRLIATVINEDYYYFGFVSAESHSEAWLCVFAPENTKTVLKFKIDHLYVNFSISVHVLSSLVTANGYCTFETVNPAWAYLRNIINFLWIPWR